MHACVFIYIYIINMHSTHTHTYVHTSFILDMINHLTAIIYIYI